VRICSRAYNILVNEVSVPFLHGLHFKTTLLDQTALCCTVGSSLSINYNNYSN